MPISFVIAFSLISATAYAQEQNQTMDKSNKYFAIQNTKTSIPENVGPEHQQYHQIALYFQEVIVKLLDYYEEREGTPKKK